MPEQGPPGGGPRVFEKGQWDLVRSDSPKRLEEKHLNPKQRAGHRGHLWLETEAWTCRLVRECFEMKYLPLCVAYLCRIVTDMLLLFILCP